MIVFIGVFVVAMICTFADMWTMERHRAAVPGSYQKYKFTTIRIIVLSFKILAEIGVIIVTLANSYYITAGLWLVFVAIDLWDLKRLFKDDNWFNNQYKRFKQGVKNLRSRLSITFSPLPSPA